LGGIRAGQFVDVADPRLVLVHVGFIDFTDRKAHDYAADLR
jgi:hypothetical protein